MFVPLPPLPKKAPTIDGSKQIFGLSSDEPLTNNTTKALSGPVEIMSSGRQQYLRISMFAKRKEGVTSEQFHKHWQTIHADVVRALPGYLNICKRYVQVFYSVTAIMKLMGG